MSLAEPVPTTTEEQAVEILDRMAEIAEREMLVSGNYVDPFYIDPKMGGAVCGGRKTCAVGSLFVAGGAEVEVNRGEFRLPAANPGNRDDYLADRPALRLAYDALNDAAACYAERTGVRLDRSFEAPVEALFEGELGDPFDCSEGSPARSAAAHELVGVIRDAQRGIAGG